MEHESRVLLGEILPRGKVIGVERDESLCQAAQVNLEMNSIENGTIIHARWKKSPDDSTPDS